MTRIFVNSRPCFPSIFQHNAEAAGKRSRTPTDSMIKTLLQLRQMLLVKKCQILKFKICLGERFTLNCIHGHFHFDSLPVMFGYTYRRNANDYVKNRTPLDQLNCIKL